MRFSGYSGNKMLLPPPPWVRPGLLEIFSPQESPGHEGGTIPHLARSVFSSLIPWALTLAESDRRRIGYPFPWPRLQVAAFLLCPLPKQRPAVQRPGPGGCRKPPRVLWAFVPFRRHLMGIEKKAQRGLCPLADLAPLRYLTSELPLASQH